MISLLLISALLASAAQAKPQSQYGARTNYNQNVPFNRNLQVQSLPQQQQQHNQQHNQQFNQQPQQQHHQQSQQQQQQRFGQHHQQQQQHRQTHQALRATTGQFQQQNLQQPQTQFNQRLQSFPSAPRPFVPITSYNNDVSVDGSYSYGYTTGDGQQQQAQGYLKNPGLKDLEAQSVQGSYSYTSPEGQLITVTYIADENGFRAEGAHLPTPPPIPEAIQKSLALIAATQPVSQKFSQAYSQQPFGTTQNYNRYG